MEKKIQIWEAKDPGRSFHYNPAVNGVENEVGSNFLNVYQEDWQKMLLRRYGNTMRLLDATYRTTKYALQLFMLVVKTNVHYVPVCDRGWNRRKYPKCNWNPEWNTSYVMVDYHEVEINDIKSWVSLCKCTSVRFP